MFHKRFLPVFFIAFDLLCMHDSIKLLMNSLIIRASFFICMQRLQRLSTFQSIVVLLLLLTARGSFSDGSEFSLRKKEKKNIQSCSLIDRLKVLHFNNTSGSHQSTEELFPVECFKSVSENCLVNYFYEKLLVERLKKHV